MMIRFSAMVLLLWAFACHAHSNPYQLNSGEKLLDSEYATTHSLLGGSRLILKVEFEQESVDSELRNASLIELLTQHLIPKAVQTGEDEIAIWEMIQAEEIKTKTDVFSFGLSAGAYENYNFSLGENWVWEQKFGPEIDLSVIPQADFEYNDELDVYMTEPVELAVQGWPYYEVYASMNNGTPAQAREKANEIFRFYSGCSQDGIPIEADSFMGMRKAIALSIYMFPSIPSSPLHYQPRLKLTYGHENKIAHCYTIKSTDEHSWDELYHQIGQK